MVTVNVDNPLPDTTPPSITITSPVDGGTVPRRATVTIAASVSDNTGVTKVEFSVNGSLKCTDSTTPYTCNWKVPSKSSVTYTLQAKAYDAAGNIGASSIRVTAK